MSEIQQPGTGLIRVEWRGNVAIVTLNSGGNGNALTHALRQGLHETLADLNNRNEDCRAIVLTGSSEAFCIGDDLAEMQDSSARMADTLSLEIFRLIVAGRRPVIAAVEGLAAGTGLSLASACDYVVATSTARFACRFGLQGLLPEVGLYWSLARRIGAGRTREAMLSAWAFDAREALDNGLANVLVAPGEALNKAVEVAGRYAEMPPQAMAYLKAAMATGSDTLDEAIETETHVQPFLRYTDDHKEAVQAFMQKRAPNFVGK